MKSSFGQCSTAFGGRCGPAECCSVDWVRELEWILSAIRENIFVVGDGSEWFLVDEEMLLELTEEMNAVLVDPLKTTIVQDYRCMTTWVLRKRRG